MTSRQYARAWNRGPRAGFTLVELLVVIAIIAVLAALATSATIQVMDSQRQRATEDTLRTVSQILGRQMQDVVDKADKEQVPSGILSLAGNDPRRARVIWKKLRLKQEFPVSRAEALNPHKTLTGAVTTFLSATDLPPKAPYVKALQTVVPAPAADSATCLLLALQVNRGGAMLTPESLGSHAVGDTDQNKLQEIVDAWGNPVTFFRWPIGVTAKSPPLPAIQANSMNAVNPALEIDKSAPVGTGLASQKFRDPLDPEGLLLTPTWWNTTNRSTFEALCHLVSNDIVQPQTAQSYYVVPLIASNGRNGNLGLTLDTSGRINVIRPQAPAPFQVDDAADNIYNFRLRVGARGD